MSDSWSCQPLKRPRRMLGTVAFSCASMAFSTAMSSVVPTFPSTTVAFRCSIHNFARLMTEPLNVAAYDAGVIVRMSRESVRASLCVNKYLHIVWRQTQQSVLEILVGLARRILARHVELRETFLPRDQRCDRDDRSPFNQPLKF